MLLMEIKFLNIPIQNINTINNHTPNPAHKVVHIIEKYLKPEDKIYWWYFNQNLISIDPDRLYVV